MIRVSNREQARIHIGQRVPIISATSVPSTQGPVITESVTYGCRSETRSAAHRAPEQRSGDQGGPGSEQRHPAGADSPGHHPGPVDTRNAQTSLRLHDGETQVLAGLVRNDLTSSGNKIPGLGDIPGLGRLFGSNRDDKSKSELVLAITPRIVRNLPYQSPSDMEFATGTESSLQVRQQMMAPVVQPEAEPTQGTVATVPAAITTPVGPRP